MQKNIQEITIGDKVITLETGVLAPQTNASVLATFDKTVVLATVVMGKEDLSKDYFPLSVEFSDKLYAGGLIKGGKWIKREMGPSDSAILFGRIIDRSVRPLFPVGFQNEVQIIVTILSNDKENDVVITAFTAVSAALAISDIPFKSAVSAVRIGLIDGKLSVMPPISEMIKSKMDLLVCTGPSGINMIENATDIVDNEIVLSGIELAQKTSENINRAINEFASKCGKKKIEFVSALPSDVLLSEVERLIQKDIAEFLASGADGKHTHDEEIIIEKVKLAYAERIKSEEVTETMVISASNILIRKYFRQATLAGQRYDKRKMDEVRPLEIQAGVLPCTHGSALFQRGLTQALTITTLGPLTDRQYLQDSSGETTKRYIHYYSAGPYSTGQTGRLGRPGRREIGHGALAEKALMPVIPSEEEFPYTIALTSEVLSQNGSSSMASTCGSTMSLMDAGVPIKDLVAGISVGMVSDDSGKYVLLTDIAGVEDHNGDMDFKITGTKTGITAIQLDIKSEGLTMEMIKETFVASTKARLQILAKMESVLSAPRKSLSVFAPKIKLIKLPEDKIGEVIGSGGKTIKSLMAKYGVQIDIDDFGGASISSADSKKVDEAVYEIESMVRDVQMGEEFDGVVTRVENYGAFVEFLPGREALLHVSEMTGGFLSDPSSIIKIGDKLHVRVSGYNDNHQLKLSAPEFKQAHMGDGSSERPQRPAFDQNRGFGKFNQGFRPTDRRR
ncbi:MAG: polyribonucleotide nucleotidyltransferase [Candidatus Shapirobacteria bacterium]|jgi:polyribonucleotide nucleotidyltransferase